MAESWAPKFPIRFVERILDTVTLLRKVGSFGLKEISARKTIMPAHTNASPVNSIASELDCFPFFPLTAISHIVYQNADGRERGQLCNGQGASASESESTSKSEKKSWPFPGFCPSSHTFTLISACTLQAIGQLPSLFPCNGGAFRVNSMYMKVNAIIPARYESSRLAGKPLLKIKDKTIIEMVYERTCSSSLLDDVVVATDDRRIFDHVLSFGGKVVMTSSEHRSGTDRIAEVAKGLDADVIVNVQGDEPLITNKVINALIRPFRDDPELKMSTVMARIADKRELFNPNVVKVVCDRAGDAIYFSRSPIPFRKSPEMALEFEVKNEEMGHWFKHVGIYGYKRDFLLAFSQMDEGMLESIEGLEQLRALENGVRIHVEETNYSGIGIDTNEDYLQLKELLGDME